MPAIQRKSDTRELLRAREDLIASRGRRIRGVVGSRSVEGSGHDDVGWAFLVAQLGDFGPDDIIVDGGASGPDSWGHAIALEVGCKWMRFMPNGALLLPNNIVKAWRSELREPNCWEHFKERNRMLVNSVLAAKGDTGLVALLDPQSKTKGAHDTVAYAESIGLNVRSWKVQRLQC